MMHGSSKQRLHVRLRRLFPALYLGLAERTVKACDAVECL